MTLLPLGTLIYTLRTLRRIAARLPSGLGQLLFEPSSKPAESPPDEAKPEFYGVVYDAARRGVFVANKFRNALWFFQPKNDKLVLTEKHTCDRLVAPCTLSMSPSHGVLIGCYGSCRNRQSGLWHYDFTNWRLLTSAETQLSISHCCWLDGQFCYVDRMDSVLWLGRLGDSKLEAITSPNNNRLSPNAGKTAELRLRYVQGIHFSPSEKMLYIADASLGAIFKVNTKTRTYELVAGRQTPSDSTTRANLCSGSSNKWLGPMRALTQDIKGNLTWLDGESGKLWSLNSDKEIVELNPCLPGQSCTGLLGSGLACVAH